MSAHFDVVRGGNGLGGAGDDSLAVAAGPSKGLERDRGGGGVGGHVQKTKSYKDAAKGNTKQNVVAGGFGAAWAGAQVSDVSRASQSSVSATPAEADALTVHGDAEEEREQGRRGAGGDWLVDSFSELPSVSAVSQLEGSQSMNSLSSCLPLPSLPLPSLNLTGAVSTRKAISCVAAAAAAATSARPHAKGKAQGKGIGGAGGGGKSERGEGETLGRGDSVCQGKFVIHQRLGTGGFGTVYLATDVMERRRIALKMQRPGKKLCQVALDEVALLTLVTNERARLLDALPAGASSADAARCATAAARAIVAAEAAATGADDGDSPVASASSTPAVAAAAAAASAAAAAAGSECVVRFYGHSIHKGVRGSQICIEMEPLGPSLLEVSRESGEWCAWEWAWWAWVFGLCWC